MPRRYFHYLLAFLLLAAQQGALVHATWHALDTLEHATYTAHAAHDLQAGDAHVHDGHHGGHDGHNHEAPTGQASLCAFDLAFGQVLGGVHGACAPLAALVLAAEPFSDVLNPRGSVDAVPALARGPPVVL